MAAMEKQHNRPFVILLNSFGIVVEGRPVGVDLKGDKVEAQ